MDERNHTDFCPFTDESAPSLGTVGSRISRFVTDRRRVLTRVLPGALIAAQARRSLAVSAQAVTPEFEARALWVNRFEYDSPEKIATIMERAAGANFNIVYFQVRGAGDAFYPSEIEPCAVGLCGRLGGEPPYDPLAVAIEEGSKRGLEVHAWLNALAGWSSGSEEACEALTQPDGEQPRHLLLQHPTWGVVDEDGEPTGCPNQLEYVYFSPSHTKVRTQLGEVAADIARRYEVKGFHLDRIRYPGRDWSYDEASLKAFRRDPEAEPDAWDDFRRGLVNQTVKAAFDAIQTVNPMLPLSASVWVLYQDRWDWGALGGYDEYFQDPRAWCSDGYLDVAVPMTYEPIEEVRCARADWDCLVEDHVKGIQTGGSTGRHVYAGIAAWHGADEIRRAVEIGRGHGVAGFSIYSYSQIDNRDLWGFLAEEPFREPSKVPPLPWKVKGPGGDGTEEVGE